MNQCQKNIFGQAFFTLPLFRMQISALYFFVTCLFCLAFISRCIFFRPVIFRSWFFIHRFLRSHINLLGQF